MQDSGDLVRLIVIAVAPEAVARLVRPLMRRLGDIAGCRRALEYPPHVTLRTGALVPREELDSYIGGFCDCCRVLASARIATEAFVHELYDARPDGPARHFYGYSVERTPGLTALHDDLRRYSAYIKAGHRPFRPHLSIAYDDISDAGSKKIDCWLEKNTGAIPNHIEWTCDSVALYRRAGAADVKHRVAAETASWNEVASCPLGGT